MNKILILVFLLSSFFVRAQSAPARLAYQKDQRYLVIWDSIKIAYKDTTQLVIPITKRLLDLVEPENDSAQLIQAINIKDWRIVKWAIMSRVLIDSRKFMTMLKLTKIVHLAAVRNSEFQTELV